MKNGILACLVISIIIGLYELYWFLYKGSELGLVLAVLSFVVSCISFYLWEKNFEKSKNSPSETIKYQLFISFYCTCGFLFLCWATTYIGETLYKKSPELWRIDLGRIPPYPFGLYILCLGIPLFMLIYWRLKIINFFRIKTSPILRVFYIFLIFIIVIGLSIFNFGLNIYFISFAIALGVVSGLIDGIHCYKQDFSFLQYEHLSEAAKLAKLEMMHESLFGIIISLFTMGFGIAIGFGIPYVLATPRQIIGENVLVVSVIIVYLFGGMGYILWDMFTKKKEVEKRILEL